MGFDNDATLDLEAPSPKPTTGDKIVGTMQELSGKIRHNPAQVAQGKMNKSGTYEDMYDPTTSSTSTSTSTASEASSTTGTPDEDGVASAGPIAASAR